MKRIIALAVRLIASIDAVIGMFVYVACSLIFHEPWNIKIFLFSMLMSHLPDFDLIPYLFIRKYMRIPSHWIVGHHPLIIIPLSIAGAVPTASILEVSMYYLATIAGLGVFLHFMHDSVQIQGLHWFSPFSWKRCTFASGFPKRVSKWIWICFVANVKTGRDKVPGNEITGRIATVSLKQWIVWLVAVSAVIHYATITS